MRLRESSLLITLNKVSLDKPLPPLVTKALTDLLQFRSASPLEPPEPLEATINSQQYISILAEEGAMIQAAVNLSVSVKKIQGRVGVYNLYTSEDEWLFILYNTFVFSY